MSQYSGRLSTPEETIEAKVRQITFRSPKNDFAILSLDRLDQTEAITAVGPLAPFQIGERLSLVGRFERHSRFGLQFRVSLVQPIAPEGIEGIRDYLLHSNIKGLGPQKIDKILKKFGSETLEVIKTSPQKLLEVQGIGQKRLDEITQVLGQRSAQQETMVFLHGLKLGPGLAARIWSKYKENTEALIKENPYRLIRDIDLFGFQRADQIARILGWNSDSLERAEAALDHLLRNALEEGHVCLPSSLLIQQASQLIQSPSRCQIALDRALENKYLILERAFEPLMVYLPFMFTIEEEVSLQIKAMLNLKHEQLKIDLERLKSKVSITLAKAQKQALLEASQSGLMLLTGGPGTGKTTTILSLLHLFEEHDLKVSLAAPTGRASRRLSEATRHEAKTLHRLLEYIPQDHTFARNRQNQIEADVVIVDEVSMVDLKLFHALLRALSATTRLILVGDANQLPSVGAGRVYHDLLETPSIPKVTLTEIFRQAQESQIIQNAHRILEGTPPLASPPPFHSLSLSSSQEDLSVQDRHLNQGSETEKEHDLSESISSDFYWITVQSNEHAAYLIEDLVVRWIPQFLDLDPHAVQVLTPMYRGACGADALNQRLQNYLNPDGKPIRSQHVLRVGDKVMQLKNFYEKDVFNGDVGEIISKHPEGALVDFEGRLVNYPHEHFHMLTLAYACSIHKSQGSEYPAVIIPILDEHWNMLQKDLLYTALTRGQKLVILLSQPKALEKAALTLNSHQRYGHLKNRLTIQWSSIEPHT